MFAPVFVTGCKPPGNNPMGAALIGFGIVLTGMREGTFQPPSVTGL